MKNNIVEYKDLKCPPKELDCILKTLIPKYETNKITPVISTPVTTATSGYFDIGSIRVQYGTGISNVSVTLPMPFANTNYSLTVTANNTAVYGVGFKTSTTAILPKLHDDVGAVNVGGVLSWFAIGQI